MNATKISWTKRTWNPVHGCHRVSEGCRYCYAESLSLRYGWTKQPWTAANASQNVMLKPHKLREPFTIKEPSMIFVNSMSDLFHPLIPDDYRAQVFDVMRQTPQHTYQILTKRPELAAKWQTWPPNVWMGATVEDQRNAGRVDAIRTCGAAVKFLSCEPLLSALDINLRGIDWIIVGGESGNHLAPAENAFRAGRAPRSVNPRWMDMQWARDLRDAAGNSGAAYFFKQDSGIRTEMRPYLVEADGSQWEWHQFPGALTAPRLVKSATQCVMA